MQFIKFKPVLHLCESINFRLKTRRVRELFTSLHQSKVACVIPGMKEQALPCKISKSNTPQRPNTLGVTIMHKEQKGSETCD